MEDLERYMVEFVAPTVADFEQNPSSVRHGFLACVVVFHAVDYRAYPNRGMSRSFRERWRRQSPDFALIDKVAHAFKHVATPSPSRPDLLATNVWRRPPAIFGEMVFNESILGDPVGAVIVDGQELLPIVRRTVAFLEEQLRTPSSGLPGKADSGASS